jgi:hypothetical protein
MKRSARTLVIGAVAAAIALGAGAFVADASNHSSFGSSSSQGFDRGGPGGGFGGGPPGGGQPPARPGS